MVIRRMEAAKTNGKKKNLSGWRGLRLADGPFLLRLALVSVMNGP